MANRDDQFEALLVQTRLQAQQIEKSLARLHPRELARLQQQAMDKIYAMPAEARSMALEIIQQGGVNGLGALGYAANVAAIAQVIAAAGQIGLTAWQMDSNKKDAKAQQAIVRQQADAEAAFMNEKMQMLRLQREQAEEQAAFARQSREAQEKAIAEGRAPAGVAPAGGAAQKMSPMLMVGGAVAAVAAVALLAK